MRDAWLFFLLVPVSLIAAPVSGTTAIAQETAVRDTLGTSRVEAATGRVCEDEKP